MALLSNLPVHRNFRILWVNQSSHRDDKIEEVYDDPLLYYLNVFPYKVAICTNKKKGLENWEAEMKYLEEVATHIVDSPIWIENQGIDFLCPASHPKTGPIGVTSEVLQRFSRQSFLRTDFDFMGYSPKDIIIPYVSSNPKSKRLETTIRNNLLFFVGGSNPIGGLRDLFNESFTSLLSDKSGLGPGTTGVDFSISSSSFRMSADDYQHQLLQSEFCLVLRGDTSSSKRLFSAILHDCIPVIVSDWLPLPFELLVDYSLFSLRLPEASYRRIDQVVAHLRNVSDVQKSDLHRYLRLVQPIFRYDQPVHIDNIRPPQLFLLNPVTMTLLEAVIRRKTYCDSLSMTAAVSSMCSKLYRRIHHASKNIQSYK